MKIQDYEKEIGFDAIDPTEFIENPEVPREGPSAADD